MSTESRVAVKLAYDGSRFYGYQRQPRERTVEGDVVGALVALGAIETVRSAKFQSSSRTDRGVSALGNVISFTTRFPLKGLCSAINSKVDDVWTYSAVAVPQDFNPRWARQRWYRYHLPKRGQDIAKLRRLAKRFEGTHDFSLFARKDDRNPVRTIDSVDVREDQSFFTIDMRAESFLWNMVRRIAWMVDAGSTGEIDEGSVDPEARSQPRRVGLAPARYLLLMDVDCGVGFEVDQRSVGSVEEAISSRLQGYLFGEEFTRHLLEILGR